MVQRCQCSRCSHLHILWEHAAHSASLVRRLLRSKCQITSSCTTTSDHTTGINVAMVMVAPSNRNVVIIVVVGAERRSLRLIQALGTANAGLALEDDIISSFY